MEPEHLNSKSLLSKLRISVSKIIGIVLVPLLSLLLLTYEYDY